MLKRPWIPRSSRRMTNIYFIHRLQDNRRGCLSGRFIKINNKKVQPIDDIFYGENTKGPSLANLYWNLRTRADEE
jgi:hypothetical protein